MNKQIENQTIVLPSNNELFSIEDFNGNDFSDTLTGSIISVYEYDGEFKQIKDFYIFESETTKTLDLIKSLKPLDSIVIQSRSFNECGFNGYKIVSI